MKKQTKNLTEEEKDAHLGNFYNSTQNKKIM